MPVTLRAGSYLSGLPCSRCAAVLEVWVTLTPTFRAVGEAHDATAVLAWKFTAKTVEHLCTDQARHRLEDPEITDEVGTRPLDFRERQAGRASDMT